MLHVVKIGVGVRDIAHLAEIQGERLAREGTLRHLTRFFPKRAAEIVGQGSLYWVLTGAIVVRQRILDIRPDTKPDGSACTALVLDAALVPVEARLMRPFQGWRYLSAEDAPADLRTARSADGDDPLPPALHRALRELCLI